MYNSRIVKIINKKGKRKSAVIIDELPTIYFRGLDNLIATARSNKVAVCLGMQDFSQLTRDYGEKESRVIQNTVGNIFAGQTVGDTARTLSERFGKIVQRRESLTISREDKSTGISTQLDALIPPSKISNLTQGTFVGAVADNISEKIDQKIFHARIVVDHRKIKEETAVTFRFLRSQIFGMKRVKIAWNESYEKTIPASKRKPPALSKTNYIESQTIPS